MSAFGPLDFIGLRWNDNGMHPLMVLCRAPADDGWLAIEHQTAVIYNLFDTIAHRYVQLTGADRSGAPTGLTSRALQAELLARATWYHHPAGIETVGAPEAVA